MFSCRTRGKLLVKRRVLELERIVSSKIRKIEISEERKKLVRFVEAPPDEEREVVVENVSITWITSSSTDSVLHTFTIIEILNV